jgi:hypothetical protein
MPSSYRDSEAGYSQSNFWRDPISDTLPDLPEGGSKEAEKEKETQVKPTGISLPTEEMTFDWMDDDAAMGPIDTDDEEEEPPKEVVEVKPKGIALPISDMSFDWMDGNQAVGSIDTDEEDDKVVSHANLKLDLESSEKKESVPEQFSPVQYWRDPIPDILDMDEPSRNANKSQKATASKKASVVKPKEKNWLANNMAGMFDRRPKPKLKVDQSVKKASNKETTEMKKDPISNENMSNPKLTTLAKDGSKGKLDESCKPLPIENAWLDKWKYDDAEKAFYEKGSIKKNEKPGNESTQKENVNTSAEKAKVDQKPRRAVKQITEEIHEKIEVYKGPEKMVSSNLKEKITSVESENKRMRSVK